MKKSRLKITAAALVLALSAATFASCTDQTSDSENSITENSSVSEVSTETFSTEDAEELIMERLPLDFENTYHLTVNDENKEWNEREYYHFLIEDEQIALETSVLVDKENHQIFTYYPDGSAYAPEDDPFCKSAEENAASSESSSEDSSDETSVQAMEWKGSFRNEESGITLTIEPLDTTSFEFNLLTADGIGLEHQVARADSESGSAQSTSTEGLTVTFTQKDGTVMIKTEGTLPDGFNPDGTYQSLSN